MSQSMDDYLPALRAYRALVLQFVEAAEKRGCGPETDLLTIRLQDARSRCAMAHDANMAEAFEPIRRWSEAPTVRPPVDAPIPYTLATPQ